MTSPVTMKVEARMLPTPTNEVVTPRRIIDIATCRGLIDLWELERYDVIPVVQNSDPSVPIDSIRCTPYELPYLPERVGAIWMESKLPRPGMQIERFVGLCGHDVDGDELTQICCGVPVVQLCLEDGDDYHTVYQLPQLTRDQGLILEYENIYPCDCGGVLDCNSRDGCDCHSRESSARTVNAIIQRIGAGVTLLVKLDSVQVYINTTDPVQSYPIVGSSYLELPEYRERVWRDLEAREVQHVYVVYREGETSSDFGSMYIPGWHAIGQPGSLCREYVRD